MFNEEDKSLESVIVHKINYITNVVLRNNEFEIFNHFNKIELSCHPFGIRWLRLLFLRELDFPTNLILWDAIFALDKLEFSLCYYIFVSLLTHLRDDLLRMDNSGCMHLLMQQQFHLNTLDVLKVALYYYNPAVSRKKVIFMFIYEDLDQINFALDLFTA